MCLSNLGQMSVFERGRGEKGIGSSPPRREASSRKVSLTKSDQIPANSTFLIRLILTGELAKLHTTSYAMLGNLNQLAKSNLDNLSPSDHQT